jgi:hypothetical protein
MWDLFTGKTMQRIVCYVAFALSVYTLELSLDDPRLWCLIALFSVAEYLSYNQGAYDATEYFFSLPTNKMLAIKKFMTSIENGETKTEDELIDIMKPTDKDDKNE